MVAIINLLDSVVCYCALKKYTVNTSILAQNWTILKENVNFETISNIVVSKNGKRGLFFPSSGVI